MAADPPEPQEIPAPLDFSGAAPGAPAPPDESAVQARQTPEDLLVAHSFGDAALLLPTAGAALRVLLDTVRARQAAAGRTRRRELVVCGAALPPDFAADADVLAVGEIEDVPRAMGPRTAGFLVAPFDIAAGLRTASGAVLAALREAADEYGLTLAFDETDAGCGRTGMAFAHEWTGVTPDLMVVGDGAGLDVAALVLTAKLARALPARRPQVPAEDRERACAALAAAFAPGFEERVQGLGWLLEDRLAAVRYRLPGLFREVVGMGLAQGLVTTGCAGELARRLDAAGLKVRVAGDVLALLPPLAVGAAQIAAAADLLEQVAAGMAAEAALP